MIRKLLPIAITILGYLVFCGAAPTVPLPDWEPPFEQKAEIVSLKPELHTETFKDGNHDLFRGEFRAGNKQIGIFMRKEADDRTIRIYIDSEHVGSLLFQGHYRGSYGFPFNNTPFTIRIDPAANTISGSRPWKLPDGRSATFQWILKEKNGKIELFWDAGISRKEADQLPDFLLYPQFETTWASECHLKYGIEFDRTPLRKYSAEELEKAPNRTISYRLRSRKTVYAPDTPQQSFVIETPGIDTHVSEMLRTNFNGLYRMRAVKLEFFSDRRATQGSLLIDFGRSAVSRKAACPPTGEIDFYGEDAMHVPNLPGRNRLPNPGFEQGLRYWGSISPPPFNHYTAGDPCRYTISSETPFGKRALRINGTVQPQGSWLRSMPLPLKSGTDYTISYYAKGEKGGEKLYVGVTSGIWGAIYNTHNHYKQNPGATKILTTEWKRYEIRFRSDNSGIGLLIGMPEDGSEALIDNIQLEEGRTAGEFEAPPVEGWLSTAAPDNNLDAGNAIDGRFELAGMPGLTGTITFKLFNYYRETVWKAERSFTLDQEGRETLSLDLDGAVIGKGVFVLQAEYHPAGRPVLTDYFRMSILEPLSGKHSNRDLLGTSINFRHIRAEEFMKQLTRCGFGAYTYGGFDQREPGAWLPIRAGFHCYGAMLDNSSQVFSPEKYKRVWEIIRANKITPEIEKEVESLAYEAVKNNRTSDVWAFSNETESHSPLIKSGQFDEWAKVLTAFARGAKRARPEVKLMPDTGAAGYTQLRGYREIEGYLRSTQGKVKWDAVSIHPYHLLDGTNNWGELDAAVSHLVSTMKRYGYDEKTPIYFTECFNAKNFRCSAWNAGLWADNFRGLRPSYDFGLTEFLQAAWLTRLYIIASKYEQVKHANCWISDDMFLGANLDMMSAPAAVNTLGHLLDKAKFRADLPLPAGMRGYLFDYPDGTAVAAVWCTIQNVESGLVRGPELACRFPELPEFRDLMNNVRTPESAPDGSVKIRLSPAPLFLIGKPESILEGFREAGLSRLADAVRASVFPDASGGLTLTLTNRSTQSRQLRVQIGSWRRDVTLPPGESSFRLPKESATEFGKMYHWNKPIRLTAPDGESVELEWKITFFRVPCTARPLPENPDAPEWNAIPAIPLTSRYVQFSLQNIPHGHPGDLEATFRAAWDEKNFYVMIDAKDDKFQFYPEAFKNGRRDVLYLLDGCAELYFDTGANALLKDTRGYDLDDYRYDFGQAVDGADGSGSVWRLREPTMQLMGALNMPSKEEAMRNVKCTFRKTAEGYRYTMIFPQRYLEPLKLTEGTLAGFAIFLHDRDDPKLASGKKGLSSSVVQGQHCDYQPHLWPIMILTRQ